MKFNILVFILIIFTIIYSGLVVGSDSSQCLYNGYDYSALSGTMFNGISSDGKFAFYWRICSNSKNSNVSEYTGKPIIQYITGLADIGEFSENDNGDTVLTYQSKGLICEGTNNSRSMEITLKCSNRPLVSSSVEEPSKCKYQVTMTGSSLCTKSNTNINTCSYNNHNYSSLIGQTFISTTVADQVDFNNKFIALISICSGIRTTFYNNTNDISLLFYLATNPNETYLGGLTSTGVFSTVNGHTVVTYQSNAPVCPGTSTSRSIAITLLCGSNVTPTISQVYQIPYCKYTATLTGSALCP